MLDLAEHNTCTAAAFYARSETDTEAFAYLSGAGSDRPLVRKGAMPVFPDLPPFLHRRTDGAIVVSGHRITLFAILEKSQAGAGIAEILNAFPTLDGDIVWQILRFSSANRLAIEAYYQQQLEIATANERPYTGPTLEKLRQRRRSMPS
jgi:uncharacterized protein (DUF433 family)